MPIKSKIQVLMWDLRWISKMKFIWQILIVLLLWNYFFPACLAKFKSKLNILEMILQIKMLKCLDTTTKLDNDSTDCSLSEKS